MAGSMKSSVSMPLVYSYMQDRFARGVVLLMSMKFMIDCYLICRTKKDSCGCVEHVFAGQIGEYELALIPCVALHKSK